MTGHRLFPGLLLTALWLSRLPAHGFTTTTKTMNGSFQPLSILQATESSSSSELREQADSLLTKARQLRQELQQHDDTTTATTTTTTTVPTTKQSPWTVPPDPTMEGKGYRLYLDIGREEGTWMDRRWGARGRRIACSLDVNFLQQRSSRDAAETLVQDNKMFGKSSPGYVLQVAPKARLRDGFAEMKCDEGCYRIDSGSGGKHTIRFSIPVEGTTDDQNFGDIDIPNGRLYFSLPCFGGSTSQLSTKEGPITIRQKGWNTGLFREESRIVGIFYAKPIEKARKLDGY